MIADPRREQRGGVRLTESESRHKIILSARGIGYRRLKFMVGIAIELQAQPKVSTFVGPN